MMNQMSETVTRAVESLPADQRLVILQNKHHRKAHTNEDPKSPEEIELEKERKRKKVKRPKKHNEDLLISSFALGRGEADKGRRKTEKRGRKTAKRRRKKKAGGGKETTRWRKEEERTGTATMIHIWNCRGWRKSKVATSTYVFIQQSTRRKTIFFFTW